MLGGVTAKTGAALCANAVGCVPGGFMVAFGLSDAYEGADGLFARYEGKNRSGINPLRYGINQINPSWGDTAYDGLNLMASVAALRVSVPLKIGNLEGMNRPKSMFGVSVPNIRNQTLIPFINRPAPYGTTQSILLFGAGSKTVTVVNDINKTGEEK